MRLAGVRDVSRSGALAVVCDHDGVERTPELLALGVDRDGELFFRARVGLGEGHVQNALGPVVREPFRDVHPLAAVVGVARLEERL